MNHVLNSNPFPKTSRRIVASHSSEDSESRIGSPHIELSGARLQIAIAHAGLAQGHKGLGCFEGFCFDETLESAHCISTTVSARAGEAWI